MSSYQIPEGYKQTEVGVIPDDWEVAQFTEVTTLITCGIAATPQYVPDGQGFPFLSSSNVKNGHIIWSNYKYITSSLHKQLHRNNPPKKGDILYSRVGTIGEAAVIEVDFEFSIYVSLTLIKTKPHLNNYFLMHLLNSSPYKQRANDQVYLGGGVGNLNVEVVRDYPIVVPPLPEQRSIAQTLSDVDALIAALDQLIAKKRHLKTATMQQLLTGKKRLPGFGGEWHAVSMSQHANLKARIGWQALTTAEYLDNGSFFLVTGTDFQNGAVNWSTCHFVSEWRYSQDKNIQLHEGDVLLTKDGTIGKVGYVENMPKPATLNSGVFVIRPIDESFHPRFLYYVLDSEIFDDFLRKIFAGSTISHLYQKDFVTFEFLAPDLEEQREIATVLSDMDAAIAALEARRAKTQAIKQGMMQELLTGRTRLV